MFNIGFPELVLILVLALVIFGPKKLPEVGKALGNGIKGQGRQQVATDRKVIGT